MTSDPQQLFPGKQFISTVLAVAGVGLAAGWRPFPTQLAATIPRAAPAAPAPGSAAPSAVDAAPPDQAALFRSLDSPATQLALHAKMPQFYSMLHTSVVPTVRPSAAR